MSGQSANQDTTAINYDAARFELVSSNQQKSEYDPTKRSLNEVDDDALLLIIDRFAPRDRFRLETINKQWQRLCTKSWRSGCLQMDWLKDSFGHLAVDVAKTLWRRCGREVQSVNFSHCSFSTFELEEILEDWAKYEPRCQEVTFSGTVNLLSCSAIGCLKHCKRMENLNLEGSLVHRFGDANMPADDEVFGPFLKEFSRLKSVKLSRSTALSLECLKDLPETVESLDISKCKFDLSMSLVDLGGGLLNSPHLALKHLWLADIHSEPIGLSALPNLLPNLTLLDLSFCSSFLEFPSLAQLPNLEVLYLNNIFTDLQEHLAISMQTIIALTSLQSACRLKLATLHLNNNTALPREAFLQLGNLPTLSELSLEGLPVVSQDVVLALSTSCSLLRALTVRNCANFDDRCLAFLAQQCLNLVYLDVSRCPQIHWQQGIGNFLRNFFQSFDERMQMLELYASNTGDWISQQRLMVRWQKCQKDTQTWMDGLGVSLFLKN